MTALAFPIKAATLTPHQPPMLAIDHVLSADDTGGQAALKARADAWYMTPSGRWDEVAGIELIAQAAAAINGIPTSPDAPPSAVVGYLAEVRSYEVTGSVSAGNDLTIDVRKTTAFGGFLVMSGVLRNGTTPIATAELTFWRTPQGDARKAPHD